MALLLSVLLVEIILGQGWCVQSKADCPPNHCRFDGNCIEKNICQKLTSCITCTNIIHVVRRNSRSVMSDSAMNVSQHLHLFNKAHIHLGHVIKSVRVDQSSTKVIKALVAYANEVRAITQPVEAEGHLTGQNYHVEKKRKKVAFNTLLEMLENLKNEQLQFELISMAWWAKSNGENTTYLLHRVALTCYSREMLVVASKIGLLKSDAQIRHSSLAAMVQVQMGDATRKAIVDALKALDEDSVFREKFEENQSTNFHYNQMKQMLFNPLFEKPITLKKLIELAQRELSEH